MIIILLLGFLLTLKTRFKLNNGPDMVWALPSPFTRNRLPAKHKQTLLTDSLVEMKETAGQSTTSSYATMFEHLETFKDVKQVKILLNTKVFSKVE